MNDRGTMTVSVLFLLSLRYPFGFKWIQEFLQLEKDAWESHVLKGEPASVKIRKWREHL